MTTQQALELAGLTEDLLCSGLDQYVTNNTNNTLAYALTPVPIQEPAQIQGFRIGGGRPCGILPVCHHRLRPHRYRRGVRPLVAHLPLGKGSFTPL